MSGESIVGGGLGGIAATLGVATPAFAAAAPAAQNEFNRIRPGLFPIACWRIEELRFDFDSSVVLPGVRNEIALLARLVETHGVLTSEAGTRRPPRLSVFGHADSVGTDEYNKLLAGRRAAAIYGMLTRRVEIWEDLHDGTGKFTGPAAGDAWGVRSLQVMLDALGLAPGATDGKASPQTRAALERFQGGNGLPPTGSADAATRRKLFLAYMDAVCRDSANQRFQIEPKDFLGGNADPAGKGDFQGCGEFNPVLILSKSESAEFEKSKDKTKRNEANRPNRRVVALLFRPGPAIEAPSWPCPRTKEGTAGCRKRFFADAKRRVAPDAARRHFDETGDTFACRFYDRMATRSPCERAGTGRLGLLFARVFDGPGVTPLAGRRYVIQPDPESRAPFEGTLDDDGMLRHEFVMPGHYTLRVEGCDETTPLVVLDPGDDVPQIRLLENARLKVEVRTPEGAHVEGATVNVEGVGHRTSDADGLADFGSVPPGKYNVSAAKAGFGSATVERSPSIAPADQVGAPPDAAQTTQEVTGSLAVAKLKLAPGAKPQPVTVVKIGANVAGTGSVRATQPTLPAKDLRESTSSSDQIEGKDNPPVVLVRCDALVQLEAVTNPPGQAVKWSIRGNPKPGGEPGLTPDAGGTKAALKTDRGGSFSVTAEIGASKIVWNVVFVDVKVDLAASKSEVRQGTFVDGATFAAKHPSLGGWPTDMTGAFAGEMDATGSPWFAVARIKLTGGGASGDLGVDKIRPQFLQNLLFQNIGANYDDKKTVLIRRFASDGKPLDDKIPMLDANEGAPFAFDGPIVGKVDAPGHPKHGSPQGPFCFAPAMCVRRPIATGSVVREWEFTLSDGPAQGFPTLAKSPSGSDIEMVTTGGFEKFRSAIASYSVDAPNVVAVHADTAWLLDWTGKVSIKSASSTTKIGTWTAAAGDRAAVLQPWREVGAASGGLLADKASFEIYPPLAINDNNKIKPAPR